MFIMRTCNYIYIYFFTLILITFYEKFLGELSLLFP